MSLFVFNLGNAWQVSTFQSDVESYVSCSTFHRSLMSIKLTWPQRKLPISNESQVKPQESIIQRNTSSFSRRNSYLFQFVSSKIIRFLTLTSSSVHVVDKQHLTHYHMINVLYPIFYPILLPYHCRFAALLFLFYSRW